MLRFDGAIAGLGSASGTRLVVGMWPSSPLGSFTDVMIEDIAGHRTLLAPSAEVAEFVSATYTFDEVRLEPTALRIDGSRWSVTAESLQVAFELGGRPALGALLRAVPRRLARARWFVGAIDPVASRMVPGVHTRGSAGGGRREWYCALDLHTIAAAAARWQGQDLGALRPVAPPVRFGFGSTPVRPSVVRITTWIDLGRPPASTRS